MATIDDVRVSRQPRTAAVPKTTAVVPKALVPEKLIFSDLFQGRSRGHGRVHGQVDFSRPAPDWSVKHHS